MTATVVILVFVSLIQARINHLLHKRLRRLES